VVLRRERLAVDPNRDRLLMDRVAPLQAAYLHRVEALPAGRAEPAELRRVRWMLEEYRVSLWAQQLGTPQPVSDTRIRKALDSL
jgi:ATP-dependent helicase HrpA